jgi:hypothetical protein
MIRLIPFFLLFTVTLAIAGEFRTWANPDKTKTFEGQFVSLKNNLVTILLKNFNQVTFSIDKLHKDDQAWIRQNQSSGSSGQHIPNANPDAVFDTLIFGEDRDTVTKKLFASKMVQTKVASTHIGRTGLNGIFYTKEKIGGLTYTLTFNWDDNGKLIEVTLQSETKGSSEYDTALKSSWQEISELLVTIYGKAKNSSAMPRMSELGDDQMLANHVWRLDQGGNCLLGTSKMEGGYQVVIRFVKQ